MEKNKALKIIYNVAKAAVVHAQMSFNKDQVTPDIIDALNTIHDLINNKSKLDK